MNIYAPTKIFHLLLNMECLEWMVISKKKVKEIGMKSNAQK